jgi:hypothetical protein
MKQGRSRIWVDPFQSRLFLRVVLYWSLYQLSLWNFLFAWRLTEEGQGNLPEQYWYFFLDFYPMIVCFALLVPFFAWDAVRFSHRLVGPLVRFRRTMQAVTAGQPVQPIRLRQGDYLTELQEDFNAMLIALQKRGLIPAAPAEAEDAAGIDRVSGEISRQHSERGS